MGWLTTTGDTYINLDLVRKVKIIGRFTKARHLTALVTYSDGHQEEHEVFQKVMVGSIIPANPDWFLLGRDRGGDGPISVIARQPIIAWTICGTSAPEPMTAEGPPEFDWWAMQSPDGRVFDTDTDFDDVAQWLAYLNDQKSKEVA